MKRLPALCWLVLITCTGLKAQHCPYDGSYMIAVYLVDAEGKPVSTPEGLILKEKINPLADSCSYAEGQLVIPFAGAAYTLMSKYKGHWQYDASLKSKHAEFMKEGNYVVVLNMSQHKCMVKSGADFRYSPRRFTIEINGKTTDVPQESIYSLCTSAGYWDRIKPLVIIKD